MIQIDENILVYAFRYALGRRTYAPTEIVKSILKNWDNLSIITKELFKDEIKEAYDLGDRCDQDEWKKIIFKEI